ncbi:hypothetical protein AB0K11_25935 [Mycobacterium sp. NPDC050551]|uniref:anti-sigma factor family protein n=1 Tax=Mycobacterium sp. NPDC050551 TaxID=3155407 RepID=UPI00342DC1B4
MSTDDNLAEWDAAYVLGALTPAEQQEYERYLAADPARSAQLDELRVIPSLLDALTPEEAYALLEPVDAGDGPGERAAPVTSLADARAERKSRSRTGLWTSALAAAAALLLIGGFVGYAVIPRQATSTGEVTLQAMSPGSRGGVSAALAVSEKGWGTRFDWTCEYTAEWATDVASYDLVVTTVDGAQSTVASWSPAGDEATGLAAATVIPTTQIRTVDIRVAGTDTKLAVTTVNT